MKNGTTGLSVLHATRGVIRANVDEVAKALKHFHRKIGGTTQTAIKSWQQATRWLGAPKVTPRRFVLVPRSNLVVMLTDSLDSMSKTVYVSSRLQRPAVWGSATKFSRFFVVLDAGATQRALRLQFQEGMWEFVERGNPQAYEHVALYKKRL